MPQRPSKKKKVAPAASANPKDIQAQDDRRKLERARELAVNTTIDQFQGRKSVGRA